MRMLHKIIYVKCFGVVLGLGDSVQGGWWWLLLLLLILHICGASLSPNFICMYFQLLYQVGREWESWNPKYVYLRVSLIYKEWSGGILRFPSFLLALFIL